MNHFTITQSHIECKIEDIIVHRPTVLEINLFCITIRWGFFVDFYWGQLAKKAFEIL